MLVLLFLSVYVLAAPQPPLWANQFWQNFTEHTVFPIVGTNYNNGTYYYDWTNQQNRIDRSNGRYNSVCGLGGPYEHISTPCIEYITGGNRFFYYPAYNTCFYCCNSTDGCGILIPNWMSDATYVDTEIHNGISTYKWEKTGNQPNYMYETTEANPLNRTTISIYQEPDDFQDFGPRSLILPPNIFTLPSVCTIKYPSTWGACKEFRKLSESKRLENE